MRVRVRVRVKGEGEGTHTNPRLPRTASKMVIIFLGGDRMSVAHSGFSSSSGRCEPPAV